MILDAGNSAWSGEGGSLRLVKRKMADLGKNLKTFDWIGLRPHMKASWNPRSTRNCPLSKRTHVKVTWKMWNFQIFFCKFQISFFFLKALCPFYGTDIEFVGLIGTTIITGFKNGFVSSDIPVTFHRNPAEVGQTVLPSILQMPIFFFFFWGRGGFTPPHLLN